MDTDIEPFYPCYVIATVVWIGGILITLLVILPGSKTALGSQRMVGKLMKEVAKRFTPMAIISLNYSIADVLRLPYQS